jgi:hypothetical protein
VAPAAVAAVAVTLHMIDNLMNAMLNPAFVLMAGGLAGLAPVAVADEAPAKPAAAPAVRAGAVFMGDARRRDVRPAAGR